jgi:hypothetical protein
MTGVADVSGDRSYRPADRRQVGLAGELPRRPLYVGPAHHAVAVDEELADELRLVTLLVVDVRFRWPIAIDGVEICVCRVKLGLNSELARVCERGTVGPGESRASSPPMASRTRGA